MALLAAEIPITRMRPSAAGLDASADLPQEAGCSVLQQSGSRIAARRGRSSGLWFPECLVSALAKHKERQSWPPGRLLASADRAMAGSHWLAVLRAAELRRHRPLTSINERPTASIRPQQGSQMMQQASVPKAAMPTCACKNLAMRAASQNDDSPPLSLLHPFPPCRQHDQTVVVEAALLSPC